MKQAQQRLHPKARKEVILIAAIRVARKPGGWNSLTRDKIAREAHCADSLVSLYLGSMMEVRKAIMKAAIKYEYLDIIGQGIASGDRLANGLPVITKHRAINCLFDQGE